MPDKEKVIKGLECCRWSQQNVKPEKNKCDECPYKDQSIMNAFAVWRSCTNVLAGDALALLKEQEPHVLTLNEAVDGSHVYYVEFQYHVDRGWVKCDFDRMYVDGEIAMLFLRNKTFYQQKEAYGRLWRLWSARPTYDQMKAVKWE